MNANIAVFVIAVATFAAPQMEAARRITGRVVDEDGRAVSGARVSVHMRGLSPRARAGQDPATVNPIAVARAAFNSRVQSDSGGAFAFSEVPTSAVVQVCVSSPDPLAVDQCAWSRAANRLAMDGDNDAAAMTVKAERGYPLTIRIQDPQHLLPDPPAGNRRRTPFAEEVLASVRSEVLGPIPLSAENVPGGRVFRLTIPYDTPIPLNIEVPGRGLKPAGSTRVLRRFSQLVTAKRGVSSDVTLEVTRLSAR